MAGTGDSQPSEKERQLADALRRLDLSQRLPSMVVLSLVGVGLVALLYGIIPLIGWNKMSWSSGPLSPKHAMIANDCKSCHASAFVQVRDDQCLACHAMTDHVKGIHDPHASTGARCAQCHMDHNGEAGLVLSDSRVCTECHADIEKHSEHPKIESIEAFEQHPEFAVRFAQGTRSEKRVRLDDRENLKDRTQIKLNHKVHLKEGLDGPDGPVTLQCGDCHKYSSDLRSMVPISREQNCKSCHPLGFDERLPDHEVPHGNAAIVYSYLYAEYAKLFLGAKDSSASAELVSRMRPGMKKAELADETFTRKAIVEAARTAEEEIFTRTGCFLCHQVEKKDIEVNPIDIVSRYDIVKPHIPEIWFPGAAFDHGAHQELTCGACHKDVRDSTKTTDVLLPGIATCKECHGHSGKISPVSADCVTCHSYHDPLILEDQHKRELGSFVSYVKGEKRTL